MTKKLAMFGIRLWLVPSVTITELILEPVVRYKKFRRK